MSRQFRARSVIGVLGFILLTMACVLPGAAPQAVKETPTPTPAPGVSADSGGPGGSNGASQGGSQGGNGAGSGGSSSGGTGAGASASPTPTLLADISAGPYVVKQIQTLGGEVISGTVCSLTKPFGVQSTTPKVTFTFLFVPRDVLHGQVSYAYSVPKAGESHQANGTYTIVSLGSDGTLQLSLSVSDHVVFKGFDGNMPIRYKFNLVPTSPAC